MNNFTMGIIVLFSFTSISLSQNMQNSNIIVGKGLHKIGVNNGIKKTTDGEDWAFMHKGDTTYLSSVINDFADPFMLPLFYSVKTVQQPAFMSHQITDVYKESYTIPGVNITEYDIAVDLTLIASQSAVPGDYIMQYTFKTSTSPSLTNSTTDTLTINLTILPDVLLPEKPQLVSPITSLTNQLLGITFKWNSVPNALEYSIQLSKDQQFGTIENSDTTTTDTTKTISGFSKGQQYYWRVRAKNSAGISPWSDIRNFTTLSAPMVPVAKTATVLSATSFAAHWDSVSGASGYLLDVSTSSTYSTFVTGYKGKNVAKVTSYTLTNLTPNIPHFYRVRAYNQVDSSGYSNSINLTLVGVDDNKTDLPNCYELSQNFPNPFNPSTSIQYGLPSRSTVRLVIYNVLGQVVKELINTEQQAGMQSVVWNANASSGLYFYKLEATSKDDPSKRFIETKKMLLLK